MNLLDAIAGILAGLTGPQLLVLLTLAAALVIAGVGIGVRVERRRWRMARRLQLPPRV